MKKTLYWTILVVLMQSCTNTTAAPVAREIETRLEKHGDIRIDPYYWMKDRENPEVIQYIKDENQYTEQVLAPVKKLEEALFQELRQRTKEDEATYPYQEGSYFYYTRYEKGSEYPIYARRAGSITGAEEILVNVNELSRGHTYYSASFPVPSPDHTKIIFAVDMEGRRFYDLFLKDLRTGEFKKIADKTAGDFQWANDNQTIFFVRQDPETLRSQWLFRKKINDSKEALIFTEKDEAFSLEVTKSKSKKYIFLESEATLSSEVMVLDANKPEGKFKVFLPREEDHLYSVEETEKGFYVLTNWKAKNFRLMLAGKLGQKKSEWKEVIPNRKDVLLQSFENFKNHLVVLERKNGLTDLRVMDKKSGNWEDIDFPEASYVVDFGANEEYNSPFFRYSYQSMVRPDSVYDYDFTTRKSVLRKQAAAPNLDLSQYASERIWATARDGTKVPVSLIYKKGFKRDGSAPLHQYAYGSYGDVMEPWFDMSVFSLLDRGFVYAIAHVRGGSEMGRYWYDDGKLLKKMNTFTDFIDVTEFLLKEKYAAPGHVYAEGMSAGGLLVGAVSNMRPDLYRGMIAGVPFVDVLTTMLDDSIPLTTGEYDEWGNPNEKKYYDYMKQYSPYDNVEAKNYPNMLITSGLHDSQVQYFEPTKWVAKLRKKKTGDSVVLLKTVMEAGHGGASGRFEKLKETALNYTFLLWLEGQR